MSIQDVMTNRRKFLERSALGFGSVLFLPSLLVSCTDHLITPPVTPVKPPLLGDSESKGVDYYLYLGTNYSLEIQQPSDGGKNTKSVEWSAQGGQGNQMLTANLQISASDIGGGSSTGRFLWQLFYGGGNSSSGYAEISPSTGNLGNSTMGDMLNTPSFTDGDISVSYGFYDAGPGVRSLTSQDQFYVYATANHSNWMGKLASGYPKVTLNQFVLPGAHDAGMFDPTSVQSMLTSPSFWGYLADVTGIDYPTIAALSVSSAGQIKRIVIDLAFTQKDTIVGMLNLGIRYFDFRPGYRVDDKTSNGRLYHQHDFIPGYPFDAFIGDTCQWLKNNPSEIVVVGLGNSGFHDHSYMDAEPENLWYSINQYSTANGVGVGSKTDLSSFYTDLIKANKRLIILPQYNFDGKVTDINGNVIPVVDAKKYDSYNESLYQTTDVNLIITALTNMSFNGQQGNDYTVLQLQGTATGAPGGVFDSVATLSGASSPLMSTKAKFDHTTYPWIQANGIHFSQYQLLVCLNDFADNALTEYCIALTQQRAQIANNG